MKNIAIITGAAGGLGKAFTKQLIESVDEVWAIGRSLEKLNKLEEELGERIRSFRLIYQILRI